MEDIYSNLHRKLLLTWIIFPIILLWLSTNYLMGILRPPSWQNNQTNTVAENFEMNTKINIIPQVPEIPKFEWQETGLLTLWFDDGWLSQYSIAYPMLEEFGYKGALAVPTNLIGFDAYLSWAQIRRLQSKGWEITSHTRSHDCNLFNESEEILEFELAGSASDLKKMGLQYENFVSPCGVNSPEMKKVIQKYYLSLRTTTAGFNNIPVDNPYNLYVQNLFVTSTLEEVKSWINKAKQEKLWLILVFHQIDDPESEFSISTAMLHNILNEIKSADLPVALPSQVLDVSNLELSNAN